MTGRASISERVELFLQKKQRAMVAGLCLFAAVRILVFAAAFPLFNSTDEQAHLDTVYQYSKAQAPGKDLPYVHPEMARLFTLYGSAEYLTSMQILRRAHLDVPIAELPADLKAAKYPQWFYYWTHHWNTEAQSPPVYYLVAALWYKAGAWLGARDWVLAYWVRFLNVIAYALFVWTSYRFVRQLYPDRAFLCVGVPALLAVFPQDVFFGINRDILSPLFSALVLLLLFRSLQAETRSRVALLGGAFLTGICFLTDISNWVYFGVLGAVLYVRLRRAGSRGLVPREIATILLSILAAFLLPLLWMARNYYVMGDLTGSKAKIAVLGWTVKPWHSIWHHPIFSLHGLAYFLQQLMRTFWRGEYQWQGNPMRSPLADAFYVFSSCLLLLVFAVKLVRQKRQETSLQRLNGFLSLCLFLASVFFLGVLSLPFDFHQCFYPSRELPYFTSGRIICGTLLPFALLYVSGFESLFRRVQRYIHPAIPFTALCLFIFSSEVAVCHVVFHSAFNFFSL